MFYVLEPMYTIYRVNKLLTNYILLLFFVFYPYLLHNINSLKLKIFFKTKKTFCHITEGFINDYFFTQMTRNNRQSSDNTRNFGVHYPEVPALFQDLSAIFR